MVFDSLSSPTPNFPLKRPIAKTGASAMSDLMINVGVVLFPSRDTKIDLPNEKEKV